MRLALCALLVASSAQAQRRVEVGDSLRLTVQGEALRRYDARVLAVAGDSLMLSVYAQQGRVQVANIRSLERWLPHSRDRGPRVKRSAFDGAVAGGVFAIAAAAGTGLLGCDRCDRSFLDVAGGVVGTAASGAAIGALMAVLRTGPHWERVE